MTRDIEELPAISKADSSMAAMHFYLRQAVHRGEKIGTLELDAVVNCIVSDLADTRRLVESLYDRMHSMPLQIRPGVMERSAALPSRPGIIQEQDFLVEAL